MKTNQLPAMPTPKFTETIRGVPCITVTEHEHLMRVYALQALAQVQGEPFGYIHHYVAHDNSGVIIDTTWEADGCADALPHPTQPAAWKWSHATPFYTTPQPAQAAQAEVTDGIRPEDFTVDVVVKPMGGFAPVNTQGVRVTHKPTGISVTCDAARSQHTNRHQAFEKLRAILALRPAAVPMTRMKDGEIAATVNSLRDIARQFHGHDSLRERIANVLVPALKAEAKKETP